MAEASDVNELLQKAQQIGEPPTEEEQKAAAEQAANEPPAGSFERFMGTFSNPARWRG